jgi:DNA mismatch repair protein MutL
LPEHIASQIAAGEVIERPASVVKEFVENSIDAQATRIEISISADCRDIRVADNGCGMEQEDAALAFQRHATSKLRCADDLWKLNSLGFRGEAIPSIASVSHMVCLTRQSESITGSRVEYLDGTIKVSETGCSPGTVMEITDLFYNVPARLGFMKRATTEFGHIQETVQSLAIANPSIAFTLTKQHEVILKTSGSGDLRRVIVEAGHFTGRESLIEVRACEAHLRMEVRGYVARPLHFRGDRKGILTIVNKRPVRCPLTYKALDYAYSDLIPRGKYPLAVLEIKLDPAKVDVNIHPSKKELKYADGNSTYLTIQRALTHCIRQSRQADQPMVAEEIVGSQEPNAAKNGSQNRSQPSLLSRQSTGQPVAIDSLIYARSGQVAQGAFVMESGAQVSDQRADPSTSQRLPALSNLNAHFRSPIIEPEAESRQSVQQIQFVDELRRPDSSIDLEIDTDAAAFLDYQKRAAAIKAGQEIKRETAGPVGETEVGIERLGSSEISPAARAAAAIPADWRIAGYIHNTYIIVETSAGMEIIEQHIAHERALYERILARQMMPGRTTENLQPFLVSAPLELSPEQQSLLEANLELLNQMGFDFKIDEDGNTAVTQIPQEISGKRYAVIIQDLLDQISGADSANMRLEATKSLACQAAIKNGMPLSDSQMRQLLIDWLNTPRNDTCPHGRPIRMKYSLDRLFQIFHP